MTIDCKVVDAIRAEFGRLWQCVPRSGSIEIVTPYLYPDGTFVSAFVTVRGDRIIVSDGGQLDEFVEATIDDSDFRDTVLAHYAEHYAVKPHVQGKRTFFYKDCSIAKLVPSVLFDVCNFATSVASASALCITEEQSLELRSFKAKADRYLSNLRIWRGRRMTFSHRLPEVREATFSAVITSNSRLWLVPYITGSSATYFQRSISDTIVNIGLVKDSRIAGSVEAIVPLVNDTANGYDLDRFANRLGRLRDESSEHVVNWSERKKLRDHLAA